MVDQPKSEGLRVVREPDVFKKTRLSRSQRWRLERDGRFPKRIQLSGNSVAWFEHEIDDWLRSRARVELGTDEQAA